LSSSAKAARSRDGSRQARQAEGQARVGGGRDAQARHAVGVRAVVVGLPVELAADRKTGTSRECGRAAAIPRYSTKSNPSRPSQNDPSREHRFPRPADRDDYRDHSACSSAASLQSSSHGVMVHQCTGRLACVLPPASPAPNAQRVSLPGGRSARLQTAISRVISSSALASATRAFRSTEPNPSRGCDQTLLTGRNRPVFSPYPTAATTWTRAAVGWASPRTNECGASLAPGVVAYAHACPAGRDLDELAVVLDRARAGWRSHGHASASVSRASRASTAAFARSATRRDRDYLDGGSSQVHGERPANLGAHRAVVLTGALFEPVAKIRERRC
jgi:hypothetical protein